MSVFQPPPKPKNALGYHRILSPTAGIKVSPLCLGAMNFGDGWKDYMGECDKEQSFALLDTFYDLGGNFIDTANAYQYEDSEEWIGDWMATRKCRDQMVIATKYTTGYRMNHRDTEPIQSQFVGNSMKSMHVSVEASLKKLKTSYIDLLYVHWWDFTTSVEEVMHGLHAMIMSGKVLYLGVSDTPAWVVVKANSYARTHGLRPFSVYQGRWNAADRAIEREIVPMCQDQGMALAPWAPLGQGKLRTAEARNKAHIGSPRSEKMSDNEIKISDALEKLANKKGTSLHAVAIAYLMHKTPYVFPIVGQRSVEHLKANVEALSIPFTKEEVHEIDDAVPFDAGFPYGMIYMGKTSYHTDFTAAQVTLTQLGSAFVHPPQQAPIQNGQE